MKPLALDEFKAWLKTLPLTYEVGWACSSEQCPLAHYLHETTGDWYEVHVLNYQCYDRPREPLPLWAKVFVDILDSYRNTFSNSVRIPFTSSEVLDILNRTEARMENLEQKAMREASMPPGGF